MAASLVSPVLVERQAEVHVLDDALSLTAGGEHVTAGEAAQKALELVTAMGAAPLAEDIQAPCDPMEPMSINRQTAHTIIDAAHARAAELGLRITVAVVDAGGLLKALDRMDGAPPLSAQIAEAKAQGAAVWHRDGHVLAEVQADREAFVSAVSEMTRLPLIPAAGSLCIHDEDGNVVGAVGVSGASAEEDRDCAQKGLDALGG